MRPMSRSMTRAAGAMTIAITLSRIAGLLREMVIASRFPREVTDPFWAAFRVPNLLRELLAEGAMNAAFVPVYTEVLERQGREAAYRLARSVLTTLLVITVLFGLSILFFSDAYIVSLSSGFSPEKLRLGSDLARWMAPFLLLLSQAAVLMGMANVAGRYFVPAASSALFNLAIVGCALALGGALAARGTAPITSVAIGTVVGGLLQLAVQYPGVRAAGFRFGFSFDPVGGALRTILTRMAPALIGLGGTYVNSLVDNQVASYYGDGPTSYLNYAFRLWMLPVGMFGVAISTVNLSGVSRDAALGDHEALRRTLGHSMRLTLLLTIPAAVGLIGLARPITAVLFQRGAFGAADVQATATLTALYTIGLPSYALIKLYVPTLYALRRPWVPVGVSLGVIGLKVIGNVLLWRAGAPYWFLAFTTGLAAVLNAAITSAVLRRALGGFGGLRLGSTLAKVAFASAAMIGSCFAVGAVGAAVGGFAVLVLAAQIAAGVAVLWGVLVALRVPEVRALHDTVLRRLGRRRDTTA